MPFVYPSSYFHEWHHCGSYAFGRHGQGLPIVLEYCNVRLITHVLLGSDTMIFPEFLLGSVVQW